MGRLLGRLDGGLLEHFLGILASKRSVEGGHLDVDRGLDLGRDQREGGVDQRLGTLEVGRDRGRISCRVAVSKSTSGSVAK